MESKQYWHNIMKLVFLKAYIFTAQKMKFFFKEFHSKLPLPNPHETADLVTFTEEILNGKLHFLCTVWSTKGMKYIYEIFLRSSTSFDGFNLQIPLCESELHFLVGS